MRKKQFETTVETTTTKVVDTKTGEVKSEENVRLKRRRIRKDSFFMVYCHGINLLNGLSATEIKLSLLLASRADYEHNGVMVHPNDKKKYSAALGVTVRTLEDCLRGLVSAGVMFGSRGVYTLSPELFWRGEIENRTRALEGIDIPEKEFKMPKSEEFTD